MRRRIFVIPFVLWAVVSAAWFDGASRVSYPIVLTGQVATIDFQRKFDHRAAVLSGASAVRDDGALVELAPVWVPLCWVCGEARTASVLLDSVTHRAGAWVYRQPAPDPDFTGWSNGAAIQTSLTMAVNLETGEKLVAERGSSLEFRAAQLAAQRLPLDENHRLQTAELVSVPLLSEGCTIVQAAFAVFLVLWSLVALMVTRRSERPIGVVPGGRMASARFVGDITRGRVDV